MTILHHLFRNRLPIKENRALPGKKRHAWRSVHSKIERQCLRPINTGRDPLATVPATSVRPHDDRRPSYNDRGNVNQIRRSRKRQRFSLAIQGKYDVPKQESPYQTMKEANDTTIASTRSTQRDRTQVDLVSGDQMYRVYHLNVKPGHSFGFDFETEGNRHLICRLERGCEAGRSAGRRSCFSISNQSPFREKRLGGQRSNRRSERRKCLGQTEQKSVDSHRRKR